MLVIHFKMLKVKRFVWARVASFLYGLMFREDIYIDQWQLLLFPRWEAAFQPQPRVCPFNHREINGRGSPSSESGSAQGFLLLKASFSLPLLFMRGSGFAFL